MRLNIHYSKDFNSFIFNYLTAQERHMEHITKYLDLEQRPLPGYTNQALKCINSKEISAVTIKVI